MVAEYDRIAAMLELSRPLALGEVMILCLRG